MLIKSKKNLEDILQKNGVLTPEQVSQVKLESVTTGFPIEKILIDNNWAVDEQIIKAKSELLNIPFVEVLEQKIPTEVLSKIPEPVARHYNLIPFSLENNYLLVAMADPLDLQVIEFLEAKSGYQIKPNYALPKDINKAIDDQYSSSIDTEVRAALKETQVETKEIEESLKDMSKVDEVIRDAPVARIVSTTLEFAVKSRASDVHIEPGEEKTRIRYRIDGVLQERVILPLKVTEAVVSRIKILSNMKIDEKRIPQDGRFGIKVADQEVDLRVSTLPTTHGEKVVIRLLRKGGGIPSFLDLGLGGTALKRFEENLTRPHGIILVTGPTGSGKSTTLSSALSKLNSVRVNIITLEDPVEYAVPGVNQVQVNPAAGLTFASGLRSILRQDPNIIMVGEIRDSETAELAVQSALTGHLVLSTLHTNSSAGALPRLLDMGVEPFLIASSMNIAMAQRLCREICPKCKEKVKDDKILVDEVKKELGNLYPSKAVTFYKGKGCPECNNTGYTGRIGIFEVLKVSEKISQMVLSHASAGEIEKQAVAEGMIRMKQDGYLKVLNGLTTVEEVLRVAQD
ncbi:type II secretion system protein GspE [candidate division WWE3 bacterium CG_4_8_14_3_um_filter_42_11]|uniref:Type II secretion system protein GspE n=2 Tax=Katanobacteria TaxID=422282 RepID=A0A2M8G657_UNCKA|nr:MAG: type II secretion system protein GspE [candidate division WWE3 bacterium CG_4_8_14_3_um_filter_42_11]